MLFGNIRRAVEGHKVSCGEDGEIYQIIGGFSGFLIEGRRAAGSLDSVSTCPCKAALIPSYRYFTYQATERSQARSAPPNTTYANPTAEVRNLVSRATITRASAVPAASASWGNADAEPGFYLVPRSTTREQLQATLFPSPNAGVLNKLHSLNPGSDLIKAGTMIVLSDPNNQRCTREEAQLMAAATKANEVLNTMSPGDADFMMRHRDEIATFLGLGSTAIGVGEVMFAQHLNSMKALLKEIDELHRRSFKQHGHLRAPEFFAQRKQLMSRLDAHMNGLMRKGLGLSDHPKLKSAMGISSRSLVHHWSQGGVASHLPGHATHINALARAAKIVSAGGYVGVVVGGGASYLKVQEVCSAGNTEACERVKFTEAGSFSGAVAGSAAGAAAAVAAGGTVCVGIGAGTLVVGGIVCGLVLAGGGAVAGGALGVLGGEYAGEVIYEAQK